MRTRNNARVSWLEPRRIRDPFLIVLILAGFVFGLGPLLGPKQFSDITGFKGTVSPPTCAPNCDISNSWLATARLRFGYAFKPVISGRPVYRPALTPQEITGSFTVVGMPVVPFTQSHGFSETLGFRIGALAYSTDVVELDDDAFAALAGIELWIVDCLRREPHPTHANLFKVLAWIEQRDDSPQGKIRATTYARSLEPRLRWLTQRVQVANAAFNPLAELGIVCRHLPLLRL